MTTSFRLLFAILCTTVLSFSVTAQASTELDIPYTEFTLDNGLRLIVHEDHKAPIVAINIWYHVGSKNEKPGKTGFAHLFEHLMFQGTENYDDEYFGPFEKVGATDMNGTTNQDRTNYFETVPKTAVDMALWMESDRMGHLRGAISQERLDEQRGVVQNEKREGENRPYGAVYTHILENVFPVGHPYSWSIIGSMDDLNAASLEDVKDWFNTYYGPSNAVIVMAGDIDTAEAKAKVEKYFGDIPPGPPIAKYENWAIKMDQNKREIMQDRVPQARVYKVWGGPEFSAKDADLLQLAGEVLSSGKTSRLYKRLVYTDQIATDTGSGGSSSEIGGLFMMYASVQPGGDVAVVEKAMDEEMARFLKEGPTKEELERIKTSIKASVIRGAERVGGFGGKSDILAENAVFAGDPSFYKKSLSRTLAATPEEITAAANRWLTVGSYTLEVVPFPELAAAATGADRSKIPDTTDFPKVTFDKFERSNLSNGMALIVATRSTIPAVNFSLQLDAGFAADQFGEPGTSSLAMAMLDEGTKKRNALEISDELASLGASIGAGSGLDSSTVGLSALKEYLDASLEIYADVVLNPSFPTSELERLRKSRLAQIQQEKNRPITMALRTLPALLYGNNHAYSAPLTGSGTEESVARIDRDALVQYHNTWFKPNNATMIVVGDTTMAEIKPKLEKLFGKWKPGNLPTKNIGTVKSADEDRVFILDRPGAPQSIIFAGNLAPPVNNENEIAVNAMNDILGGVFTARVNMNLREDKHWAYGAFTFIWDTKGQRPFIAYAPVQTDKTSESMIEIKRELVEYLTTNKATDEELSKVQASNTLSLPGRWETAGAVLRDLSQLVTYDLPDNYWDNYADSVRNLNLQQIDEAADDVIKPDKLTWVVVGDRAKIEESIRNLELGKIGFLNAEGKPVE